MVEGDQVPLTPFNELGGNPPGVVFWQYGPSCVNVGKVGLVMTMVMVVIDAHCPALGVKVYTCEPTADVLMTAGDHVPEIGVVLFDTKGKFAGVAF